MYIWWGKKQGGLQLAKEIKKWNCEADIHINIMKYIGCIHV